jgi:predicted site-specific integrase-resolvase
MKAVEVNAIYRSLLERDLMTPDEVAAIFHVHRKTVNVWSRRNPDKLVRVITPGGRIRYRRANVEALLVEPGDLL